MNIAKILMYTFKILLNESIERSGIGSLETISISERLDLLVVEEQKEIYNDKGIALPIMNFRLKLEHSVREDIYQYFVCT